MKTNPLALIVALVRAGETAKAQTMANSALRDSVFSPETYIQLVRWTEGRSSSLDEEYGPR